MRESNINKTKRRFWKSLEDFKEEMQLRDWYVCSYLLLKTLCSCAINFDGITPEIFSKMTLIWNLTKNYDT